MFACFVKVCINCEIRKIQINMCIDFICRANIINRIRINLVKFERFCNDLIQILSSNRIQYEYIPVDYNVLVTQGGI